MDPLLIDVPERVETPRLVLRCPRAGDGAALNEAVCASLDHLRPWMAWAQVAPSPADSEANCRRSHARFLLREDLVYMMFDRTGRCVGGTGLHRMDWKVRRFEIGYWRRPDCASQGIVSEAVAALTRVAFDTLAARRVEIRMDAGNAASRRVAERAGYTLEGTLRSDSLTVTGEPRDTCVYARVSVQA